MERSQAKFFATEVLAVFLKLNTRKSRASLSKEAGLGEGSIRTILNILKHKNLIESNRKGHIHSQAGAKAYSAIRAAFSVSATDVIKGAYCIHVKPPLKEQKSYKLRDIAVRWGAEGAIILKCLNGQLVMPPSKEVDYEEDFSALLPKVSEGDYLILVWGASAADMLSAGLAIASELSAVIGAFSTKL